MSGRSKYMWTDLDRERKTEVSKPPQSAMEASPSEVTAGPSKTTTEVATQPQVEATMEPITKNISEVPAMKTDRELQGTDGNTDNPERVKEYSAQGTEKRQETTQPQLVEGAPNTAAVDIEEAKQIKAIVALRRKMRSVEVSIASTGNPGVASTTVDIVSPIVLEIPVDEASPEAEKAKPQEAMGLKEKLETENIAQSPVMTDEVESLGSDRVTEVVTPLKEDSVQFPDNDGIGQDGDEMIEVPKPVKKVCAETSDMPMKNEEEDEGVNANTEVSEIANESPAQVSEKQENPAETSELWKENISVTPDMNDTDDDDWPVETIEYPEPLKEASAKAPENQEETTEASGIEGEATQILLEEGAAQEVESFKKTLALRRMLPSVIPDNELILSTIHELTPGDMANLLEKMGCLDCKAIPSPYRLFQCPRGYHYCFECGAKRFTKDDKGDISSTSCDHEMEATRDGCKVTRGIGNGFIHPDFPLAEGEFEELPKDEKTGKVKCCLRIRKSMGDVLYKAIYNNTKWECPNMELGCRERILGRDIEEHMMDCIRKFGFL